MNGYRIVVTVVRSDYASCTLGVERVTAAATAAALGEEIIYVFEGTLEYEVEGKPPVTVKPGDVLFVPTGTI